MSHLGSLGQIAVILAVAAALALLYAGVRGLATRKPRTLKDALMVAAGIITLINVGLLVTMPPPGS